MFTLQMEMSYDILAVRKLLICETLYNNRGMILEDEQLYQYPSVPGYLQLSMFTACVCDANHTTLASEPAGRCATLYTV